MNTPSFLSHMTGFIRAFTRSRFVENEVLKKLPKSIPIQFAPEFNEEGQLNIIISSPEYEGIVSEAKSMEEALMNAHDAILTYFDVPRDCAKLIQYKVTEENQETMQLSDCDESHILRRSFRLKQLAHA